MGGWEWGGEGGGGGWGAEGGVIPSIGTQTEVLCVQQSTEAATVNMTGQDGRWQQFDDTPCSLINAPQWLHMPCSGL